MTDTRLDELAPVIDREAPPVVPLVPAVEPEAKVLNLTQKRLDEIIVESMSRAGRAAKDEAAVLRTENERLKAQVVGGAPDSSEVEKLRAQVADSQLMAAAAERRATAQSKEILQAKLAAQIDAVDGSSVSKLLRDNLQWNASDKRFDVLTDDGVLRTNPDGSAMTPEALYSEFAETHLWSIKGRVLSGGGGTSSSGSPFRTPVDDKPLSYYFGAGSNAQAVNALSIAHPDIYRRKRAEAVRAGILVS